MEHAQIQKVAQILLDRVRFAALVLRAVERRREAVERGFAKLGQDRLDDALLATLGGTCGNGMISGGLMTFIFIGLSACIEFHPF